MEPLSMQPYQRVDYGALRTYQFPALADITQAVFSRWGGVSPSPWHSLNLGHTAGDAPENIRQNFAFACQAIGVEVGQAVACHLVHGNDVLLAESGHAGQVLGKADAIITQSAALTLTMRYADCVPLLFYDQETQSIGLAHAGWRGTLQNVMGAVVAAMVNQFGSRPQAITVAVGPSIGPCCYQVGPEVFEAAQSALVDSTACFRQNDEGLCFDLWQANAAQAAQAGLEKVVVSQICTACHTDEFFSHRAERGRTGRFGVFLSLKQNGRAAMEARP
jgi:YfiH family protein